MSYNKQLTNRACSGRTGEYWTSVVAVRTSGQYSPVRPSRSVSKRLIVLLLQRLLLLLLLLLATAAVATATAAANLDPDPNRTKVTTALANWNP